MATFGIEEEVFIVEPTRPSNQSLYYMGKLVWQNPKKYLRHTDTNFSRKKDLFQGLMSAVEISTFPHNNIKDLIDDLKVRRVELNDASEGLIIALGHLFNYKAPTNTAALQFHVGNIEDPKRTYDNLVYFLPLLTLMTANSPLAGLKYHSKSYRLLNSYAVGPLNEDWSYRFQDIIYAKRTKTIEIRAFDPVWDIKIVEKLAKIIEAIVNYQGHYQLDSEKYNRLRVEVCRLGYGDSFIRTYEELNEIIEVPQYLFKISPSDIVLNYFNKKGLVKTYLALNNAYINGKLKPVVVEERKPNIMKKAAGFAGYYIPKLPYDVWKYLRET